MRLVNSAQLVCPFLLRRLIYCNSVLTGITIGQVPRLNYCNSVLTGITIGQVYWFQKKKKKEKIKRSKKC